MVQTRFQPGKSGNPKGRIKGNTTASSLREAIRKELPSIINALIIQAKAGDPAAIKLLLDRGLPALKPKSETITFDSTSNDDPAKLAQAIINKMASGEITADDANTAMAALSNQCKIYDIVELTKKVDELLERTK